MTGDTQRSHPRDVLFRDAPPLPLIPVCEHFAGNEQHLLKALAMQAKLGPLFDLTCDCEDGAPAGAEQAHAAMVARLIASPANHFGRVGARIHGPAHPAWRMELDTLLRDACERIAYITLPKSQSTRDVATMIEHLNATALRHGREQPIPVHVLIETHGALKDAFTIAGQPGVETLDFGLMDFVSGHHGAIPAAAMKSPGQFEHHLIVRAKARVVAAALAHGVVPAHNVSMDLDDPEITRNDARRARHEFGFMRMWSVHPRQIQPIVDAMQPSFTEVVDAANVLLLAWQADWGPVRHAGQLYDRAAYRHLWETLERARTARAAIPEAAEQAFFSTTAASSISH